MLCMHFQSDLWLVFSSGQKVQFWRNDPYKNVRQSLCFWLRVYSDISADGPLSLRFAVD